MREGSDAAVPIMIGSGIPNTGDLESLSNLPNGRDQPEGEKCNACADHDHGASASNE